MLSNESLISETLRVCQIYREIGWVPHSRASPINSLMFLEMLAEKQFRKTVAQFSHAFVVVVAVLHLLVEVQRDGIEALRNEGHVPYLSCSPSHSFDDLPVANLKKQERKDFASRVMADTFDESSKIVSVLR